ncbi:MAG TPA: DUF1015 domain-containing protein [Candidatus Thermoplasmatota archaeon]|nr:DUF1015 domain-containing protein [Candidatus Thermoplasmatota archaeon]
MVEIRGLRGIEFDATKVELGKVVAPPFDVINDDERQRLGKLSPYNLAHVTLPKAPRSGKTKDPHEHASQLLDAWLVEGVLKEQPEEAVYAYEIWYTWRHQEKRMRGVLVGLKVDPTYKQVVPHERIFDKPAEERLKLLRATTFDLEPIWLLYSGKTVEETLWAYIDGAGEAPDILVTGPDGAIHKLWRVVDPAVAGTVLEGLKGRKAYIADGHHRYATAVKYAEERRLREYRPAKTAPYEYKMVLLTNMNDPGLGIRPTHRVVKAPKKVDLAELRTKLSQDFDITEHTGHGAKLGEEMLVALERSAAALPQAHMFALYGGDASRYWLLRAKENVLPDTVAPGRSFTWRSIDTAYLQKLILEKSVGIPEKKWGDDIYYTRDEAEAISLVHARKASLAVFHLPTKLAQLRAIADGAEVMPPKSTYFTPKPLSGLVLHRIGRPAPPADAPKRRFTS